MARLFISQERLDEWTADAKAKFASNRLDFISCGESAGAMPLDGCSFSVEPAVRFVKVAGDEEDPNELLGSVMTENELNEIGADLYMSSVIHGDIAYDVQCGFIGVLAAAREA